MKILHILENRVDQVKSYDEVYGKIMLDIVLDGTYKTIYMYKGVTHRNDGKPAVVWESGMEEWWKDGMRHNEDGPALLSANGTTSYWYLKGKKYTEAAWKKKMGK